MVVVLWILVLLLKLAQRHQHQRRRLNIENKSILTKRSESLSALKMIRGSRSGYPLPLFFSSPSHPCEPDMQMSQQITAKFSALYTHNCILRHKSQNQQEHPSQHHHRQHAHRGRQRHHTLLLNIHGQCLPHVIPTNSVLYFGQTFQERKLSYFSQKMHLRIFIVVSTVVLKNSSIDCVAKLSVEVDGNLIAHPEKFSL